VLRLADAHGLLPSLWGAALQRGWFATLPIDALGAVAGRFSPGTTQPALLLQQAYHANSVRVTDLLEQGTQVLGAFAASGLTAVPLKGWHALLAGWWPDPARRTMLDLDVLVAEADATRAAHVLAGLGYVAMAGGHDPYADHELPPVHLPGRAGSVEIHTALTVRRWRGVLPAEPVVAAGAPMTMTDAATHLIAHAQLQDEAHLLRRLPLRSLHELAVVSGPDVDWDLVRRRFSAVGAEAALDGHLHLTGVLFGGNVPPPRRRVRALAHERLCRALLERPSVAVNFERVVYAPRALRSERMHELHGPGPVTALRAVHLARAASRSVRRRR
jgi:hypothetical protein